MSLTAKIQNSLSDAFDTSLADAIKAFTFVSRIQTFDPETNTLVNTDTQLASRGLFSSYKITNLNDTHIQPNDVKLIVLQHELSIVPKVTDRVIQAENVYSIINIKNDPVSATWTLQCRQ